MEKNNFPGDHSILTLLQAEDSFRKVWIRAIARAWNDDKFRQALIDAPEDTLRSIGLQLDHPVVLDVVDYEGDKRYEYDQGNPQNNGWVHMVQELSTEVTFFVPPTPAADNIASALADFRLGLIAYPFTAS